MTGVYGLEWRVCDGCVWIEMAGVCRVCMNWYGGCVSGASKITESAHRLFKHRFNYNCLLYENFYERKKNETEIRNLISLVLVCACEKICYAAAEAIRSSSHTVGFCSNGSISC